MKNFTLKAFLLFSGIQLIILNYAQAQYPSSCGTVESRANSNGLANKCPNVNGTAYAANFAGTSFATVPALSKTGDITFRYANSPATLRPFAITKVWNTATGTTLTNVSFGPASVPTVSGNDVLVNYCFYGTNMPTAGTISFEMTNPETGLPVMICSFDGACNSGCVTVSNPIALLPLRISTFLVKETKFGVQLDWTSEQEGATRGYQVQRSVDGTTFTDLDFVAVKSSTLKNNYTYTDNYTGKETALFYRLRQLDLDGGSTFSKVMKVSRNGIASRFIVSSKQGEIVLRSNPGASLSSGYAVALYAAEGSLKAEKRLVSQGTLHFSNLTPGLYYIRVVSDNGERHTFSVSCR